MGLQTLTQAREYFIQTDTITWLHWNVEILCLLQKKSHKKQQNCYFVEPPWIPINQQQC